MALGACCAATMATPSTPTNPATAATNSVAQAFLNKATFSPFGSVCFNSLVPFASTA